MVDYWLTLVIVRVARPSGPKTHGCGL